MGAWDGTWIAATALTWCCRPAAVRSAGAGPPLVDRRPALLAVQSALAAQGTPHRGPRGRRAP